MARTTKKTKKVAAKKAAKNVSSTRVNTSVSRAEATRRTATTSGPVMSVLQLATMYVLFLIANAIILYAASMLFPQAVVLGTHTITPMAAVVYSMLVLTSLLVGAVPIIESVVNSLRLKLGNMQWMFIYLVLNVGGLWVLGRFAEELGMGLSSWMVAVALGFVLNIAQGLLVGMFVSKVE